MAAKKNIPTNPSVFDDAPRGPCPSCDGTGKPPPFEPIDRSHPVRQWLEAEEEFVTGKKPKVNMTPIPPPEHCFRCGGSGRIMHGGL